MRHMHGVGQPGYERSRVAYSQRRTRQSFCQTTAFDVLHGEVRPAVVVANVVDVHDVIVPKTRNRLSFTLEPCELLRLGVGAAEEHLQRDQTVESEMPGTKNDSHAATAEHRFDLVARDLRQGWPLPPLREQLVRWREEGVEIGPDPAHPPPAVAD